MNFKLCEVFEYNYTTATKYINIVITCVQSLFQSFETEVSTNQARAEQTTGEQIFTIT